MNCRALIIVLAGIGLCVGAMALEGSGDSAVNALETIRPTLDSIGVPGGSSVEAAFSEPMLAPGDTTPGNYAVSGMGAGTLNANPDSVSGSGPYTLTWSAGEMLGGETVTLTATGVQDAVGNPIDPGANSASATGVGVAPVFSGLTVDPAQASTGDTVTITFSSSEDLDGDPIVAVNGNPATVVSATKATSFTCEYVVLESDALGAVTITISGFDAAGNLGSLESATALEIVEGAPELPVRWWPAALALLLAGAAVLAHRKRGLTQAKRGTSGDVSVPAFWFLLLAAVLAAPMALAQGPTVSNVAFVQQDDGAGGTEVAITYELDAPNGPCDITVSLSKDGGVDGFSHPVTNVTGDLTGITTGTGHSITWDIAADYPDEDIPNAALRVTADDGLALFTLTYTAGPGGSITGDSPQEVVEGNDGTQVEAVPDTNYHFVDWSDGVLTATRQDTSVSGNIDVTANFAINTHDITCNVVGNGTCVADPATVDHGDTSDITVTPATGWHIVSVEDSEEGPKPGSYTTTPITAPRTVTATFEEDALPPEVTSFDLDGGAATTADTEVTLDNVATESPTDYMASEASDFSGATWETYDTALGFTLSSGEGGTKTVYFKVRNAAGESAPVSDTIDFAEHTVLLPGDVPLTVVWIPAGSFDMGRYTGEQDSSSSEDPQHSVSVPGFWMGKYELTKAQWTAVMGTTPWNGQIYVLNDPDSPAVYVSWNDAQSFITTLNGLTGLTFRLPSEAEWEYACRAGTTTRFYWGDDPSYTVGNAYCWWRYNAYDVNERYAHIVGLKTENAFGLYDMSGNAWEWCEDDWHSNYTGAPTDGSAWVDSPRGSYRVRRGGCWHHDGYYCRSAGRNYGYPSDAYNNIGFRLAR